MALASIGRGQYTPPMLPRTLILRTAGTNCDLETAHAFTLAGATAERVHLNRVLENPRLMDGYQLLAIPGGFSYGDDINSGRIFANQIVHHLRDAFTRFVEAGKPIIGICNGFQVLVKTDLLPGPLAGQGGQTATLTNNDSHRFVDKWIKLRVHPESRCIWTRGLADLDLPVAHGEGKFVPSSAAIGQALWDGGQVAVTYCDDTNPNGSADDIAGVCDATGLIFGLMPHPERFVTPVQHPAWTSRSDQGPRRCIGGSPDFARHGSEDEGQGLAIFRNSVVHVRENVGAGV